MTPKTNARLAGFTFLFYIAVGLTSLAVDNRATNAPGTAAKLARLAEHAAEVRANLVLSLVMGLCALVLAVTLHALTRDESADLARLAAFCRVGEGLVGLAGIPSSLGLLKLATLAAAPGSVDPAAANALGGYLLSVGEGSALVCSILFAAGSTLFCYLFLRARSIPAVLAWLGVFASVLLLVALPAQLGGLLEGPATGYVWMPMLLFEVAFALWLIIKGVAERADRRSPHAKALSAGGVACAVGSANLDITASYWESEVLLVVENQPVAEVPPPRSAGLAVRRGEGGDGCSRSLGAAQVIRHSAEPAARLSALRCRPRSSDRECRHRRRRSLRAGCECAL